MSEMPNRRSVLAWLRHHRPVALVYVDEQGNEERLLVDPKNTNRWSAAAADLERLGACVVRALDSKDNVLASMVLREVETEAPPTAVTPATTGGYDVAAVAKVQAEACVLIMKETALALGAAFKESAVQLAAMAKSTADTNEKLMKALQDEMEQRREEIAAERAEREREAEQAAAQAEQEQGERAAMGELMGPIIAAAGPALAGALSDFLSKKQAARATPMNGAPTPKPIAEPAPKEDEA